VLSVLPLLITELSAEIRKIGEPNVCLC